MPTAVSMAPFADSFITIMNHTSPHSIDKLVVFEEYINVPAKCVCRCVQFLSILKKLNRQVLRVPQIYKQFCFVVLMWFIVVLNRGMWWEYPFCCRSFIGTGLFVTSKHYERNVFIRKYLVSAISYHHELHRNDTRTAAYSYKVNSFKLFL